MAEQRPWRSGRAAGTHARHAAPGPATRRGIRVEHGPTGESEVDGVRPYLITGGRASPIDASLKIEAQVLATEGGVASLRDLAYEHRDIVQLCIRPLAVAEVAAKLGLHLGVARVLVADLVALGLLGVHRPDIEHNRPYIIERVIRGLEAIR
jgi:hypothetical protein